MQFDTTLSLDVIVAIVGIFVAVWRLNRDIDKKNSDLRADFNKAIADFRKELKTDNSNLRVEMKTDNATLRKELKADYDGLRKELKDDNATLQTALKAVEDKVDLSNQRLARLEGVILSREGLVDEITRTDPTS